MMQRGRWLGPAAVAALAALAYLPSLLSSPGRMPADTKLYLYLDPGRLIADAPFTFDGRQFAGWVPHQVIAYLWPQGPWYWLFDRAGVADWVAHRLWLGTLFVLAGTGVLWCARRLGLGLAAAFTAAVVYQLSPYVLPYESRTSAMLLPWAGLGWLVGLTVLAATRSRWRHAALAALVVFTVGAVNATAILMVAPAPVLWLVVAALERRVTWRRAVATAARIGGLSLAVSSWWMVAVVIQGRSGADVLSFSESLEAVSHTSTSPEVWRGMGYWLDYVRDPYAATTTAAADHMVSLRVIAAGYALVLIGVTGLVVTAWAQRRFAVTLVVAGVLLGVGVHPITSPTPLMDLLLGDGSSGAGLALRSSTRAIPLLLLGLGCGAGALVEAAGRWLGSSRQRIALWTVAGVGLVTALALVNLPSLTGRRLVDPALARDESPPAAWTDAAAALDALPAGARVLQLPGQEFGAYRWGYTVDPPLPGLTDRPVVTRDLLPLGTAPAMDLLYALDDRFQAGTVERAAIAPIARFLGADTIWVTGDAAFERFRTPRPETVDALFAEPSDGLGPPMAYGAPVVNEPAVPILDEAALSDPAIGRPVSPVQLVPVEDPVPVVRAGDELVLVTGSGEGLVDAAAAGLLDGDEVVRYTGTIPSAERAAAVEDASRVVLTDSNRRRARHWRSSQDVTGFTESAEPGQPRFETADGDERLDVVGPDGAVTDAVQVGPVRAWASAYGEPFAYRPEDRAVMAIDGDPTTAWVVGDRADPVGEHLRLETTEGVDHVTVRQPEGAAGRRHLSEVAVRVDDREPVTVALDDRSLGAEGQRIDLPSTDGPSTIVLTIAAVSSPDPTPGPVAAAVGFAEVDVGLGPTVEVVRLADDLGADLTTATPASWVMTRLRVDPTNRWRDDPEPTLVRSWNQPTDRTLSPEVTVRLDARASDEVLATLLGIAGGRADRRLTGVPTAAGWSATDGDLSTSWTTPFAATTGASLTVTTDAPTDSFTLTQPGGTYSTITSVRVTGGGVVTDAPVTADATGVATVALPVTVPAGDVVIEIRAVTPALTVDRRYGEPVELPAAVSEVSIGARTSIPAELDTGCRDDLVTVDGEPLAVRVRAPVADLLAGDPVMAVPCRSTLALAAGRHLLTTEAGSGLDVDRVVLDDRGRAAVGAATDGPTATVTSSGRLRRTVAVDDCPDGCWLVVGEGYHEAWSAAVDGVDLGPPTLVAGGFNGWELPPSTATTMVDVRWTAQTPLTVALLLTAAAVAVCVALAVLDRRRRPAVAPAGAADAGSAHFELPGPPLGRRGRWIAAAVWVVTAALFVRPAWGLVAAIAAVALVIVLGRPRWAGVVALVLLAVIALGVLYVVQRDRPAPDAGWPVRFERVHELGLFAAVSLLVSAMTPRRGQP